jgi:hypothetical protein
MTSWLGLLSVFADVVTLAALAVAVVSRRVSRLARLVISTLAFACAWLVAAGFDAIGVRGWTIFLGAAVIVVSLGVVTATLHLWAQGGNVGPGHRGAHGGGGPRQRRPDAPQPGGGGSALSWWADFERQFADYVAETKRSRSTSTRRLPTPPRRERPLRRT